MTTAPSAIDSTRQRLRAVFGGSVGNLIEWYDWYTYSACSIYFAPLFFPNDDPTTQLLNSAAIYAGGQLGEQDFETASEWFAHAASRGMTDSQFNLGMLYARVLGVAEVFELCFKWFSLAAQNGDADAG